MRAKHFELLVEEPSMEAFLNGALPVMLPEECTFRVYPFQSRNDMLRKLESRLRGYARWLPPEWRVIVLTDRDQADCYDRKGILESAAAKAGLRTRSVAGAGDWQIATRVVIEELEAWYFGGWSAVLEAYPNVDSNIPRKAKYRIPDAIPGGTWEAFERELQRVGYFKGGLRKVEAASEIAQYIDPRQNRSHSFRVFRDAILEAVGEIPQIAP